MAPIKKTVKKTLGKKVVKTAPKPIHATKKLKLNKFQMEKALESNLRKLVQGYGIKPGDVNRVEQVFKYTAKGSKTLRAQFLRTSELLAKGRTSNFSASSVKRLIDKMDIYKEIKNLLPKDITAGELLTITNRTEFYFLNKTLITNYHSSGRNQKTGRKINKQKKEYDRTTEDKKKLMGLKKIIKIT